MSYVDIWDDSSAWGPNRSSLYNIQDSGSAKPFDDTDKRSFMLVHGGSYWYVPTPDYAGNIQLNRLSEMNENAHQIFVPGGRSPRAAFGYLFGTQIAIVWKLYLLERPNKNKLEEMLSRLADEIDNSDFIRNEKSPTLQLANELLNSPIAIVSSREMGIAAERFATQINENAARFARFTILPEMNHNEIIAWGMKGDVKDPMTETQSTIILDSPLIHSRNEVRMKWFTHHIKSQSAWKVQAEGESLLECLLHVCILMDWTSCALSLLHGKDPSSIPSIKSLKRHLSD